MTHQALLITAGDNSKRAARLNKAANDAGLALTEVDDVDAALTLLESWSQSGYPPRFVLIGPDNEDALMTAKNVFRVAPGTHIVFAVDADDQHTARERIASASLGNSNWSIADIYSDNLSNHLGDMLQSDRRHQWNKTLDRFNRQISQHPSDKPSEYRKLLASEKYLNTLLSITPNAVIAVTPEGEIVSWNRSASVLFNLSEQEAIRKKITDLADGQWRQQVQSLFDYCLQTRERRHAEFQCTVCDSPVFLEIWLLPIEHGTDAPELFSLIVHDVTQSKYQERALRRANEELERSNIELQQFAYIASHDLQSPLRSISGFLQLLHAKYGSALGEEAGEWIDHTVNNVEKLQTLINDLLRYSRVESRARPFTPVDLGEVFDSVTVMLGASIRDARATVTRDELPVVSGDPSQLAQLLLNLFSNAIKYQGPNPPMIHVSARRTGDDWLLSVSDNGAGIEERHRERIFEIFRRLHTDRTHPGTGIGLAVCRRVIQRHGGKIWVESDGVNGSTFYFTLPAEDGRDHEHSDTSGKSTR